MSGEVRPQKSTETQKLFSGWLRYAFPHLFILCFCAFLWRYLDSVIPPILDDVMRRWALRGKMGFCLFAYLMEH